MSVFLAIEVFEDENAEAFGVGQVEVWFQAEKELGLELQNVSDLLLHKLELFDESLLVTL